MEDLLFNVLRLVEEFSEDDAQSHDEIERRKDLIREAFEKHGALPRRDLTGVIRRVVGRTAYLVGGDGSVTVEKPAK